MADYLGTSGDDVLDQKKLGLADWSGTIRGLAGNDKITGGNIHLQGGAGDDVLTGTNTGSTVNYWDSPAGVVVNLSTGSAKDGWGGSDTLVNIHIVQGSSFSDLFIGSTGADNFWVGIGDVVQAGAGVDMVTLWDQSSKWQIKRIGLQHIQVVELASGRLIDLTDVEKLQFQDVTLNLLYDEKLVYKDASPSVQPGAFIFCHAADLNQDGHWDLIIGGGSFPPNPIVETAPQVLMQQSNGSFAKATIAGSVEGFVHPREVSTGDFNGDGITDIVVVGHGYDTAPFTGETPTVLLGKRGGGFLDVSEVMPQTPAFTHSVAVADVNRDGLDDIFLGNIWGQQQYTPKLLLGLSTGSFAEAALPTTVGKDALKITGTTPVASLMRDVTGDGLVDLVAGGGDTGVFIYKGLPVTQGNMTGPFFSERNALPVGRFGDTNTVTVDIQAMDIDHDGREDLLISQSPDSYVGRSIQLLIQTPQGTWQDETALRLHEWSPSAQWITFINLVDLNQDGHKDILASGTSDTSDVAFINDGSGHFYPAGPSNGVPKLNGSWWLPAEPGKLLSVQNSSDGLISVHAIELKAGYTGPQGSLPALAGAPGFNEQYYLRQHPSVAADVASGHVASGLADYLASGIKLSERAYAPGTTVWGSEGLDIVKYKGAASAYKIFHQAQGDWGLTGGTTGSETDVLKGVERIRFADQCVALDIGSSAGQVAKTLGAVFGKTSIANKTYVGIGLDLLDKGMSYDALAGMALKAAKITTNDQLVTRLWTNVVGSAPSLADKAPFIKMLEDGMTQGALAHMAAETALNAANIDLVGLGQTGIEYLPVA